MFSSADFPFLTPDNHKVIRPADPRYNCIAWAAGDDRRWWQPTGRLYWPPGVPRELTLDAYREAFAAAGYEDCDDGELEDACEKIVLYRDTARNVPTHAARQLPNGEWTSKMGQSVAITHSSPQDLVGPVYGHPVQYMRRKRS